MVLAAFLIWILTEIAAALLVVHLVGLLWCVLLLLVGIPLGGWLLRAEGRAVLTRLRDTLAAARPPGPGLLDGGLVLLAAPLFMVPGFVTDLVGLMLLVPPVRRAVGRWLLVHAQSRAVARAARFARGARRDYDVDASTTDGASRPRGDRPQLYG